MKLHYFSASDTRKQGADSDGWIAEYFGNLLVFFPVGFDSFTGFLFHLFLWRKNNLYFRELLLEVNIEHNWGLHSPLTFNTGAACACNCVDLMMNSFLYLKFFLCFCETEEHEESKH